MRSVDEIYYVGKVQIHRRDISHYLALQCVLQYVGVLTCLSERKNSDQVVYSIQCWRIYQTCGYAEGGRVHRCKLTSL